MAVMVGTGSASQRGILIRNAESLERIGRATQIVFDKTGTLTVGRPVLTEIQALAGYTEESLLQLAASVESPSEHPIAKAIVSEAKARGLRLSSVSNFAATPGRGVRGEVDGKSVVVDRDEQATSRVIVEGIGIGTLTLNDRLRDDAEEAMQSLMRLGIQVSMLSGDKRSATQDIAERLGLELENVIFEATPESKAATIRSLGKDVIMVGDGLNDAAALAQSGLGVALA
jgi:Cu+-exporting ATPase